LNTPSRILLAMAAALVLTLGPAVSALAHPLGNFTVNRYSRIELWPDHVTVRYVVDMAEIPTFQEMPLIDLNHDGQIDAGERASYLKTKIEQLRQGLSLQIDARPVTLAAAAQDISFPAGQGGLATTRVVVDFAAPIASAAGSRSLAYRDDNYADRLGWKEIIIRGSGVTLAQSSVPATDRSAELTAYPNDMLTSPLDQREAHATFMLAAGSAPAPADPTAGAPAANILDRSRDDLAALIATEELSLPVVLLALVAAAGLGALHSLSPGHGKTVVGAYLVGSRGTARHALFLGLTVTLTHTAGVFALGLVTLFASQFILPEQLYPWLSLLSGLFVALIGVSLFVTRLRSFFADRAVALDHADDAHAHNHEHGGDHTHAADHEHAHGDGHTHGSHSHSHLPVDASGKVIDTISWRNLLALGISGGLLPCPSALVVLLAAISLHRVAFGLLLIVAFSAGLAGVLTAIGLLLVYAGRQFERVRAPGGLVRLLPAGSALVVTALGMVILVEALGQVGLLR
jgi:nickel/cobalt exporter